MALDTVTGDIEANVYSSAVFVLYQFPRPEVLALDLPLGLPNAGSRACDVEARRRLGAPRASSVFPAPVRGALEARTREEASRATQRADGRRVGAQLWSLLPRILEFDLLLRREPGLQGVVREAHPEVSFREWNGGVPMRHSKRTREGRVERAALVRARYGGAVLEAIRRRFPRRIVGDDDILDAFAALWTAERVYGGVAATLPGRPERDPFGLAMEIVV